MTPPIGNEVEMTSRRGTLSETVLLTGAWYALVQASHLLSDAVLLANGGSIQTALGVSLLGREEFGKAPILLGLADRASGDIG